MMSAKDKESVTIPFPAPEEVSEVNDIASDSPEGKTDTKNMAEEAVEASNPKVKKPLRGLRLSELGVNGELVLTIYAYADPEGVIRIYGMEPLREEVVRTMEYEEYLITAKFSYPSKSSLDRYRERSLRWNDEVSTFVISRVMVKRFVLRNNLLELILPEGPMRLEKTPRGALTEETMDDLDGLHPSILDLILSKFESESGISLVS